MAWVRTAIGVMAFGFLVKKFDLFLEVAARTLGGRAPTASNKLFGDISALLLGLGSTQFSYLGCTVLRNLS